VDVSGVGLQQGDSYEVRDALNWTGSPVASGQYTGGLISIPMSGLNPATPVGSPAIAPVHTAPEFGTFLMLPLRSTPTLQPSGSFNASPDTLPSTGGTVTLSWNSQNANAASIDRGVGVVPVTGTATAPVSASETFTLTLTGPGGTATYRAAVVVRGTGGSPSPRDFQLEQNYPNPFNPNTRIVFTLPATSSVTLSVHDMLGREVSRLITGRLGPGTYTVDFSGKGLASGVYFYTIKADNYEEVRKMIIER
jgi:hypothetical protein